MHRDGASVDIVGAAVKREGHVTRIRRPIEILAASIHHGAAGVQRAAGQAPLMASRGTVPGLAHGGAKEASYRTL